MYVYVQTSDDGHIESVSHFIEQMSNIPNLYFIEDIAAMPKSPSGYAGWKYIDGEFIPPIESKTELQKLSDELQTIDSELRNIFNEEKFQEWLNNGKISKSSNALQRESRKNKLIELRSDIILKLESDR